MDMEKEFVKLKRCVILKNILLYAFFIAEVLDFLALSVILIYNALPFENKIVPISLSIIFVLGMLLIILTLIIFEKYRNNAISQITHDKLCTFEGYINNKSKLSDIFFGEDIRDILFFALWNICTDWNKQPYLDRLQYIFISLFNVYTINVDGITYRNDVLYNDKVKYKKIYKEFMSILRNKNSDYFDNCISMRNRYREEKKEGIKNRKKFIIQHITLAEKTKIKRKQKTRIIIFVLLLLGIFINQISSDVCSWLFNGAAIILLYMDIKNNESKFEYITFKPSYILSRTNTFLEEDIDIMQEALDDIGIDLTIWCVEDNYINKNPEYFFVEINNTKKIKGKYEVAILKNDTNKLLCMTALKVYDLSI